MRKLSGLWLIFCLMLAGVSWAESTSTESRSVTRETVPVESVSPYRFDVVLRGASRSIQSVVLFPVSAESTSGNPTSLVLPGMSEVKGVDLYTADIAAKLRSSESPVERPSQAIFRFSLTDSLQSASRGNVTASEQTLGAMRFEIKPIEIRPLRPK